MKEEKKDLLDIAEELDEMAASLNGICSTLFLLEDRLDNETHKAVANLVAMSASGLKAKLEDIARNIRQPQSF